MSELQFFFKENTVENTKKAFFEYLTERDVWFGVLLYSIRSGYIANGCTITEILIQEDKPVKLGSLKAYIPCQVKKGGKDFVPTGHEMLNIVERFTGKSPGERGLAYIGDSIDFAIQVFGLGIFRVNSSHASTGFCLSIRYLPFEVPKLDAVGYPPKYIGYFQKLIEGCKIKTPPVVGGDFFIELDPNYKNPALDMENKPKIEPIETKVPVSGGGLIVHFGPTGSGKTMAMAAELEYIANNAAGLILTYEDPIEFVYVGTMAQVSSFELGKDIQANEYFTLPEMVRRHAMRKNPSVIMFGEMRTPEQMLMVVDMANSGHLVLASMHAKTVEEGIGVLAALMKDQPHMLANSLKAAIAHRLVNTASGDIVPLFEIFIPDETRIAALAKGDISEIKRVFKDKLGDQSISFIDSVEHLMQSGRIKPFEKEAIMKVAGNFNKGRALNEK